MRRAKLNYIIDVVVAAAFLVTALTGILFLLPAPWIKALGLGMPGMLGLSFHAWRWLHDWSGVAATAGVVAHLALHWRWVVAMTRRTFGADEKERRHSGGLVAGARPVVSTRPLPATTGTQQRPYSVYSAEPATKSDEPRYTRRGVIAGLAAVAATVLVGAGLLERLTQAGASTTDQTASAQAATTGTQSQSNGSGQTDGTSGQSSDATGSSGAGGAANGATQTLVSVDAASCVGCGRCLSVCPVSLFSWDSSGQRATAQNPGRCIRCHRCLQVCPANAITING